MSLALLIPLSLVMGAIGVAAFLWAMRHNQFEDLDGASWRVLLSEANGEQEAGARIDAAVPRPPERALPETAMPPRSASPVAAPARSKAAPPSAS